MDQIQLTTSVEAPAEIETDGSETADSDVLHSDLADAAEMGESPVEPADASDLEQIDLAEIGESPIEEANALDLAQRDAAELGELSGEGANILASEQGEAAEPEEAPVEDTDALALEPVGAVETGELPLEDMDTLASQQVEAAEPEEAPVEDTDALALEPVGAVETGELPLEDMDTLALEQGEAAEPEEAPVEDTDALVVEPVGAVETGELPLEDADTLALEQGEAAEPEEAPAEDTDARTLEPTDAAEMGELRVEDWDYQQPKRGQVRTGVILAIEDQEIIVDVGAKRDGIVPYADMQRMGPEALASLSVGDEVPVYILRPEDRDGNLLVSLYMARQEKAWLQAQELAESGEAWEGEVIGFNKGGLVIPLHEIRGFVPASQVPGFPRGLGQEERLERLSTMVGESLTVKVIEINRRKRRLILSATAAQRQWRKQNRERLLNELREGEVRKGTVSSLSPFGAFVDLGGADGLIHLSELSWQRVRHPREVVRVGDQVEVYVLRLDRDRQRIGLSLKRLQPEPWALVEDRYELGQLIEGTVTNVVDFGAFAQIEEGIEGLIHISELTDAPISHAREVVKKSDLLLLRIIRIDVRRKRLGLSLRRVLESEWAEWAAHLVVEEVDEPAEEDQSPMPETEQVEEPLAMGSAEGMEAQDLEQGEAEETDEPEGIVEVMPAGQAESEELEPAGADEADERATVTLASADETYDPPEVEEAGLQEADTEETLPVEEMEPDVVES